MKKQASQEQKKGKQIKEQAKPGVLKADFSHLKEGLPGFVKGTVGEAPNGLPPGRGRGALLRGASRAQRKAPSLPERDLPERGLPRQAPDRGGHREAEGSEAEEPAA